MSIFNKEKTYEFSLEGYAQCKAEAHTSLFKEYDTVRFMVGLTILIVGVAIICNPLAEVVAFQCENELLSKVAYKVIEGAL